MNLNKFIQTLKEFMSNTKRSSDKRTKFVLKEIHTYPDHSNDEDAMMRKEVIHKVLGMMFANLQKRGRPKKDEMELLDAA